MSESKIHDHSTPGVDYEQKIEKDNYKYRRIRYNTKSKDDVYDKINKDQISVLKPYTYNLIAVSTFLKTYI